MNLLLGLGSNRGFWGLSPVSQVLREWDSYPGVNGRIQDKTLEWGKKNFFKNKKIETRVDIYYFQVYNVVSQHLHTKCSPQ